MSPHGSFEAHSIGNGHPHHAVDRPLLASLLSNTRTASQLPASPIDDQDALQRSRFDSSLRADHSIPDDLLPLFSHQEEFDVHDYEPPPKYIQIKSNTVYIAVFFSSFVQDSLRRLLKTEKNYNDLSIIVDNCHAEMINICFNLDVKTKKMFHITKYNYNKKPKDP
jgi:hypothetical protein